MIYPLNTDARPYGESVTLFVDPACRIRAALTDMSNRPIPNGVVHCSGGQVPSFQSGALQLYAPDQSGNVQTLYPHPGKSSVAVTGSKGGNAALTSLLSALASLGVVVDQTT